MLQRPLSSPMLTSPTGRKNRRSSLVSPQQNGGSTRSNAPFGSPTPRRRLSMSDSGKKKRTSLGNTNGARNIRVCVRLRPAGGVTDLGFMQQTESLIQQSSTGKAFAFDAVFGTGSSQQNVYDGSAAGIVTGLLSGFNGTVFAYGQTGSGKTHTMTGSESQHGIIPRAMHHLFDLISQQSSSPDSSSLSPLHKFSVLVSYLEIYNEQLFDLLPPAIEGKASSSSSSSTWNKSKSARKSRRQSLQINNTSASVSGLTEHKVDNALQAMELVDAASRRRTTSSTLKNSVSSRSHSIFTVNVTHTTRGADGSVSQSTAKLALVDLAGSERYDSKAAQSQQNETTNINTSLLGLGLVLTQLSQQKSVVSYRNSKLTQLLRESLGGNSKTIMIACINPASSESPESLNTLGYATRCKKIKNRSSANSCSSTPQSRASSELLRKVEDLKEELKEESDRANLEESTRKGLQLQLDSVRGSVDDNFVRFQQWYHDSQRSHKHNLLSMASPDRVLSHRRALSDLGENLSVEVLTSPTLESLRGHSGALKSPQFQSQRKSSVPPISAATNEPQEHIKKTFDAIRMWLPEQMSKHAQAHAAEATKLRQQLSKVRKQLKLKKQEQHTQAHDDAKVSYWSQRVNVLESTQRDLVADHDKRTLQLQAEIGIWRSKYEEASHRRQLGQAHVASAMKAHRELGSTSTKLADLEHTCVQQQAEIKELTFRLAASEEETKESHAGKRNLIRILDAEVSRMKGMINACDCLMH